MDMSEGAVDPGEVDAMEGGAEVWVGRGGQGARGAPCALPVMGRCGCVGVCVGGVRGAPCAPPVILWKVVRMFGWVGGRGARGAPCASPVMLWKVVWSHVAVWVGSGSRSGALSASPAQPPHGCSNWTLECSAGGGVDTRVDTGGRGGVGWAQELRYAPPTNALRSISSVWRCCCGGGGGGGGGWPPAHPAPSAWQGGVRSRGVADRVQRPWSMRGVDSCGAAGPAPVCVLWWAGRPSPAPWSGPGPWPDAAMAAILRWWAPRVVCAGGWWAGAPTVLL